jgi:predicted AlkP superfamily pyrophosphatase or phosphodiesterase
MVGKYVPRSKEITFFKFLAMKIKYSLIIVFMFFAFALQSAPKGIKHVVLIGFDGWGAYSVPKVDMPTLKFMMDNGAYSLQVRSILPSSSAPNWASMLMASPPELHGYTEWGSKTPEIPSRVIGPAGIFPTFIGQLKLQRPELKSAVIYNWDGIGYLFEKQMTDTVINTENDEQVADRAVEIIKSEKPNFLFACFDEPDHVGHVYGHDSPEYYAQMTKNDSHLKQILAALKLAGIENETLVILMADHGGIAKGHGGKTLAEMQTPIFFYGKGVKKQTIMNQSIMVYDIGATIAWVFQLEFPQVWTGRPILQAFLNEKHKTKY